MANNTRNSSQAYVTYDKEKAAPSRTVDQYKNENNFRRAAVNRAWTQEQNLVKRFGQGTYPWNAEQLDLLRRGKKVPGFDGHHINNFDDHKEWGGDPRNIRFLPKDQHYSSKQGHRGQSTQEKTFGRLIDRAATALMWSRSEQSKTSVSNRLQAAMADYQARKKDSNGISLPGGIRFDMADDDLKHEESNINDIGLRILQGMNIDSIGDLPITKELIQHDSTFEKVITKWEDSTTALLGDGNELVGVYVDKLRKKIYLIGERNPSLSGYGLSSEDVHYALSFAAKGGKTEFSLDPLDPQHPEAGYLKKVFYPFDRLHSSSIGEALFLADWELKQYSFGHRIEKDGKILKFQSQNPFVKPTYMLGSSLTESTWSRLWLSVDSVDAVSSGNCLFFQTVKMKVNAMQQIVDPTQPTGLRDIETTPEFPSRMFADAFTKHYDEVAKESPIFLHMKEIVKLLWLAKWLGKNYSDLIEENSLKLSIYEPSFTASNIEHIFNAVTPVPVLKISDSRQTILGASKITLSGGVDLSGATPDDIHVKQSSPDSRVEMIKSVTEQNSYTDTTPFEFYFNGSHISVATMPYCGGCASTTGTFTWLIQQRENAKLYYAQGNFPAALSIYDDILKNLEANEWATLQANRALCYQGLGQFEEAESTFLVAIEKNPTLIPNIARLIRLKIAKKDISGARHMFEKMIDKLCSHHELEAEIIAEETKKPPLTEEEEKSILARAESFLKKNQIQQALDLYTQIVRGNPSSLKGWTGCVYCSTQLKKFRDAMVSAGHMVWQLRDKEIWIGLKQQAYVLQNISNYEAAYNVLLKALNKAPVPSFVEAELSSTINELKVEGNEYYRQGLLQQALQSYTKAISSFGNNPTSPAATLYYNRGLTFLRLGKLVISRALQDFTTAIQLNPLYIKAYLKKAEIEASLGQYIVANETLKSYLNKVCPV